MKKNIMLLIMLLTAWTALTAQIVTSEPSPLMQDSKDVVIYYHADQGNKGLINQPSTDPIYAHTGVITDKSTSNTDWKHAPSKWGDNSAKYKLEYVSPNLWKLNIGNINDYYGITDGEVVKKLAFVFRNGSCTKEGKTANGGDIFLDVFQDGLHITLTSDIGGKILSSAGKVNFTVSTTKAADIVLKVNDTEIGKVSGATKLEKSYDINDFGSYRVVATATAGGETATAEEVYSYLSPSTQKDYPGGVPKMGPVRNGDGTVTFCLAAPLKKNCTIVGSWNNYDILDSNGMYYQDYNGQRYFWINVAGLGTTEMYGYYFLVDGTYSVADPYARLVLDPYFDKYLPSGIYPGLIEYPFDKVDNVVVAVYQENINDYDWQVTDFKPVSKDNLVIYEVLLRDFTGTDREALGTGTVRGAMGKLDYLQHLGVNAIELLPITEFNGNASWGYNPNFYFAPDKAYGTPDDYKAFIDECHRRGMAVILDMVFNQTDWLHPWYQMYEVGSNPFYNADAPHAYSVLNDWNQGNPLVQQQFKDVLRYWLKEYNVDGFRFDLVKGLGDNNSYANASGSATDAYNASRVARMKELHAAMKEVKPEAFCINENLAGAKEENEMAADGELNWANINTQSAQFAMGYASNSALSRFYAPYDSRTWGSTVSYMESHDEQRLAYQQTQNGATGIKGNVPNSMKRLGSTAAQMLLCPGSHMLWQFQELGNDQSTKNASGNDTGNKTVSWYLLDNEFRKGLYESYAELIAVRLQNPELFAAEANFSCTLGENDWSNGRIMLSSDASKELITVINPNTNPNNPITANVTFRNKSNSDYQILSKSYKTEPSFDAAAGTVTVPANSYVVIGSKNVTGVENVFVDNSPSELLYGVSDGIVTLYGDGDMSLYSLSGRCVYSGRATSVRTAPGVYVLRSGSRSVKVLVK